MNTSKENLLNIANTIIGSSCDTAKEIAAIIELGLCAEKKDNDYGIRDAVIAVLGVIEHYPGPRRLSDACVVLARHCVSRDATQDLLDAARKDEEMKWVKEIATLTAQLNEVTRVAEQFLKDLDQVGATHVAQMRNTVDAAKIAVDEAVIDASHWKQVARQTQELLEKQTQETKDALDSLKEVEADSEDMERDMDEAEAQIVTLSDQLSKRDADITKAREARVHEVFSDIEISRLLNAGLRRLSTENEEHRLASVVFRKALETEKTNNSVLRAQIADMGHVLLSVAEQKL